MLLCERHLVGAAFLREIAVRAKVCVRARQRYGRRVERYGVHVWVLCLAVVVHHVIEVVTSDTAVMLHILRVSLDGKLQAEHLVGHRLHGFVRRRSDTLSCEGVGNHGLSVGEVGQQGVDGFGGLHHLRETVGVRHIILIRAGVAVAHGEVVCGEIDGGHVDLDIGSVGHIVAVTVHKLDAELCLAKLVLEAVGIQAVRKSEVWLPLQRAFAHTVIVEHKMDASVGFPEAVDIFAADTGRAVCVGLARSPKLRVPVAIGKRHRFSLISGILQPHCEVEIRSVIYLSHTYKGNM